MFQTYHWACPFFGSRPHWEPNQVCPNDAPVCFLKSADLLPDRLVPRFTKLSEKKRAVFDAKFDCSPAFRFFRHPANYRTPMAHVFLRFSGREQAGLPADRIRFRPVSDAGFRPVPHVGFADSSCHSVLSAMLSPCDRVACLICG